MQLTSHPDQCCLRHTPRAEKEARREGRPQVLEELALTETQPAKNIVVHLQLVSIVLFHRHHIGKFLRVLRPA